MPTNVTEVSQFTTNVPVPNDGENANAASLLQAIQPLADRTKFLRAGLTEYAWVGRRVVYAPGDGTVRVGPCGGVVIGGKLLTLGTETNLGSAGRASNTWFYVYAYDNAGTLTMEESTTAPVASLAFKSGDITRRYVGCFVTNGSGIPRPMRYVDGVCLYRASAASPILAASGSSASFADVSLAVYVPPHGRVAQLRARVVHVTGVAGLEVRTKGDTTSAIDVLVDASSTGYCPFDIETDSSQVIQWKTTGCTADVQLMGHRE